MEMKMENKFGLHYFLNAIKDGKIDERSLLCSFILSADAKTRELIATEIVEKTNMEINIKLNRRKVCGEYQVKCYIDRDPIPGATYFTDDWDDAVGTAHEMAKHYNKREFIGVKPKVNVIIAK